MVWILGRRTQYGILNIQNLTNAQIFMELTHAIKKHQNQNQLLSLYFIQ